MSINKEAYKDNGWFVGFTPRRNPDVVVCVLFEGGEHGALAARLATKVIKAYEDKKNHRPIEHLKPPPDDEGKRRRKPTGSSPCQPAHRSDWNVERWRRLRTPAGGPLPVTGDARPFHRAVAAPGMEQFAQNPPGTERRGAAAICRHKQAHAWRGLPGLVAALPQPQWRAGVGH